jgi:hypothetical protein
MLAMSRATSRRKATEAVKDKATGETRGVEGPGIREWLDALPRSESGHKAAAFDTRLPFPPAGGAAKPIARKLRRRGYSIVTGPKGFVVDEAEGPLRAGERDRAKIWGAGLVRRADR